MVKIATTQKTKLVSINELKDREASFGDLNNLVATGKQELVPLRHWVRGLYCRMTPQGTKSYALKWWIRDKTKPRTKKRGRISKDPQVFIGLGRVGEITKEEVITKAEKFKGICDTGVDPRKHKEDPEKALTLQDVWDRYLVEYSEGNHSDSYQQTIKDQWNRYCLKNLGDQERPLAKEELFEVNTVTIDRLLNHMVKVMEIGPTANRTWAMLSGLWTWARRAYPGLQLIPNPFEGWTKFDEVVNERILTEAELRRWGAAFNRSKSTLKHNLLFLLLTGARSGPLVHWDKRWYQPGVNWLSIPEKTKGVKKIRFICMPEAARNIFHLLVVPVSHSSLETAMDGVCALAKIEGATPHTLRKTMASLAVDSWDEDEDTINRLIGHLPTKVEQAYLRRTTPKLQAVAERVGARMWELLGITHP